LRSIFLCLLVITLLQQWTGLDGLSKLILASTLIAMMLAAFCIVVVWSQENDEKFDL